MVARRVWLAFSPPSEMIRIAWRCVASLAQMLHGERDGVEQRGAALRLGEQQTVLQFWRQSLV